MKWSPLFAAFTLCALACAKVPDLEFDYPSAEYQRLLSSRGLRARAELTTVLERGKRFLDWLIHINELREPENKITLSSPATMPAYPVDSPRVLNPQGVLAEFEALKAQIPDWFRAVVFEDAAFTDDPPVADSEFVRWGLKLDYLYQGASRWTLLEPYLGQLAALKGKDIRGYYRLVREPNVETKLSNWSTLPKVDQDRLRPSLVGLCLNTGNTENSCRRTIQEAEGESGGVLGIYRRFLPAGKELWDGFFAITSKRPDATWTASAPDRFTLPFREPTSAEIRSFLSENIEDEWRWNAWSLKLNFLSSPGGDTAHIVFEPGATPHVNGLAGSTITMDANVPLSEYGVRWTIRHEFGHVLGFPDCYHEFYDRDLKALVSYQLDITNLMCSRRGKLQAIHFDELRRAYYKK